MTDDRESTRHADPLRTGLAGVQNRVGSSPFADGPIDAPERRFCLQCQEALPDDKAARECSACHFQFDPKNPETYRADQRMLDRAFEILPAPDHCAPSRLSWRC